MLAVHYKHSGPHGGGGRLSGLSHHLMFPQVSRRFRQRLSYVAVVHSSLARRGACYPRFHGSGHQPYDLLEHAAPRESACNAHVVKK